MLNIKENLAFALVDKGGRQRYATHELFGEMTKHETGTAGQTEACSRHLSGACPHTQQGIPSTVVVTPDAVCAHAQSGKLKWRLKENKIGTGNIK